MNHETESKILETLTRLERIPEITETLVTAHRRLADEQNATGKIIQRFDERLDQVQVDIGNFSRRLNSLESEAKTRQAQCVLTHEELNRWRKDIDEDMTDSKIHDRQNLMDQVASYRERERRREEQEKEKKKFHLERWKLWVAVLALALGGSGGGAVVQQLIKAMLAEPVSHQEVPDDTK